MFNREFKKSCKEIKEQSEVEQLTDWFNQIDIADDKMPKAEASGGAEELTDVDTIKQLQNQIRAYEERERRYKETVRKTQS